MILNAVGMMEFEDDFFHHAYGIHYWGGALYRGFTPAYKSLAPLGPSRGRARKLPSAEGLWGDYHQPPPPEEAEPGVVALMELEEEPMVTV